MKNNILKKIGVGVFCATVALGSIDAMVSSSSSEAKMNNQATQELYPEVDKELFSIKELKVYTLNDEGKKELSRIDYKIIYGSEEEYDVNDFSHMWFNHPVEEVSKKGLNCADDRWEVIDLKGFKTCLDMEKGYAPELIKYIRTKLQDDPELVAVRYWPFNKTASLLFDPDHDNDKKYYGEKLKLLKGL